MTSRSTIQRGFWARNYEGERIWFSLGYLDRTCGGTGMLRCDCGGDFCVCGWNGEAECDGCADCEGEDDGWGDDDYPPYDD